MKVLHIHSFDKGGGAETVFNITRRNKFNSANYSGFIKTDLSSNDYPDINFRIYQSYSKCLRLINYIFSFHNYFALKSFLLKNEIDVVHLHGFIGALSPSILLALKKMKRKKRFVVIQTMHDFHIVCPNSLLFDFGKNNICEKCLGRHLKLFPLVNSCDRRGYLFSVIKGTRSLLSNNFFSHSKLIDKFVAPGDFMSKKMIEEGIQESRIVTIRNPVAFNFVDKAITKKDILCFFGRFSKEKDIPFIIKAFTLLKIRNPRDFKLYLIGEGEEAATVKKLIDICTFKTDIIVKDFMPQTELIEFIKPCKYFVMASKLYENAPMTILEAVSLDIIPIVPDLGGMKETIELVVKVGRTYESGVRESFVESIQKLEDNYADELKKIFDLKQELQNEFGTERYLKKLNTLYTTIVANN